MKKTDNDTAIQCPGSTSPGLLNLFGGIALCVDTDLIKSFPDDAVTSSQQKQADTHPGASAEKGNS